MPTTYTESEIAGAILSLGRLVDIRNFPDIAADVLLGKQPAFLGRGIRMPTKFIDPAVVPALVFWTKGPVDLLVKHDGLSEVLRVYNRNQAVIGLELSVTGLGETFLEPGIQPPHQAAQRLKVVLDSGYIDPESVVLRYDPLLQVQAPDGRIIRNDTPEAFENVIAMFAPLGVRHVETKALLLEANEDGKYHHVWQRIRELGIYPLELNDFKATFAKFAQIAESYGMRLFSCCMKSTMPTWDGDGGCLSAGRLLNVGKKRFGQSWNRLSGDLRPSRPGCECSRYFDLSNIKGHKKCGSQDAACIYCSASCKDFGLEVKAKIREELDLFCAGERDADYEHLLDGGKQNN